MPMSGPPMSMPRDIMGAPPAPVVTVEEEEEEEEKDMEDLVVPSGLWVEAAIICDDSAESCLTDVLPSSVVEALAMASSTLAPSGALMTRGALIVRMPSAE